MLGLIFIYWIGKNFYDLAGAHDQSPWGFGILGVASYYIGTFVFGILLGVFLGFYYPSVLDEWSETALGVVCIPFGLATTYILYKVLEKNWVNKDAEVDEFESFE